ncbi:MAG: carbohydrate binding family 9 domain-containing protein [Rhodothermales bacterium]|nr:carbohydrate binding family 9 domain-containing protein [Rhodothermales bacterium]
MVNPDDDSPVVAAIKVSEAPVIDGRVVGDPAWAHVTPATEFWQTTPNQGQAASERTEVRISFDDTYLYVGVILHDSEPDKIIISDSRRDASLEETDSFSFILDTYRDQQNGFVFGTNPAGIEYDAQVTNQGEGSFGGGRQQSGSGGGFNLNWDGAWIVATSISETGWSAEFAIPFKTLRYSSKETGPWGINFQRNIRRRNEKSFWVKLPRQYGLNRVSLAGELDGLQTPDLRNLQFIPYALSSTRRDFTVEAPETTTTADVGADLKYSLTPSLTFDATVNTDFAQVEIDEQQINLDRFNLFFPEKRPFFLENAGIFSVGSPAEVEMFFSRRIGIGPDGEAIPILTGARVSGAVSDQTKVGLLNMQMRSVDEVVAANNFLVARVQHELPNRSAIGVIATNRNSTGDFGNKDDYNRLIAIDGRLGIGELTVVSGYLARSVSPDTSGGQYAFDLQSAYVSQSWRLSAGYTEVASAFNPELGFLSRTAYRKVSGSIFKSIRMSDFLGLHEIRPHTNYRAYFDLDGFQETGYWHLDSHWEWKNGYEIHTGVNFTREGVKEAFEISPDVFVTEGTYDHHELALVGFTNRGSRLSTGMRLTVGGIFGGDRVSTNNDIRFRWGDAFTTEFSFSRNDVVLPGGDFVANLFRGRMSYSFTPRIYVQTLIQYNNRSEIWSANARFGWLRDANTGLFVVFNQANDVTAGMREILNRGVTLKYTHLFDVL